MKFNQTFIMLNNLGSFRINYIFNSIFLFNVSQLDEYREKHVSYYYMPSCKIIFHCGRISRNFINAPAMYFWHNHSTRFATRIIA